MSRLKYVLSVLLVSLMVASLVVGCSSAPSKPAQEAPKTEPEAAKKEEPPKIQFPTKPIEIIVPFTPGGAVDVTARILGAHIEKTLGQKVLVVNKAGGGAAEGQGYVARANPDGYTLLAITSSVVTNTLTKEVDFTIDSFDPIVLYCFDPEVLLVNSATPYKTLEDVIAAGKKERIIHATPGHSTSHHTAGLMLEEKSGVQFKYIHTKGGTEQIPMVAGGHAPLALGVWGEFKSMIDQGKVRVLGVMSEERDPRFPDIPTFKEKGIDLVYGAWRGMAAPKGTPPEIIEILHQAFKKALESQEVKDQFAQSGFPLMYVGPSGFKKYMQDDYENLKVIVPKLSEGQ